MKVWDHCAFDLEKNLGRAYNEFMRLIPDGDWACLRDGDTCFCTPDYGIHLNKYAEMFPDAAMMTCYTNRVSPLSRMQLYKNVPDNNPNHLYHMQIAEKLKSKLYNVTVIEGNISGVLMLLSKRAWLQTPFTEDLKCLGVDTQYQRTLKEKGFDILRMDAVYIFHAYRMLNGIGNKKHLI